MPDQEATWKIFFSQIFLDFTAQGCAFLVAVHFVGLVHHNSIYTTYSNRINVETSEVHIFFGILINSIVCITIWNLTFSLPLFWLSSFDCRFVHNGNIILAWADILHIYIYSSWGLFFCHNLLALMVTNLYLLDHCFIVVISCKN